MGSGRWDDREGILSRPAQPNPSCLAPAEAAIAPHVVPGPPCGAEGSANWAWVSCAAAVRVVSVVSAPPFDYQTGQFFLLYAAA